MLESNGIESELLFRLSSTTIVKTSDDVTHKHYGETSRKGSQTTPPCEWVVVMRVCKYV